METEQALFTVDLQSVELLTVGDQCRPMIHNPPPLNGDYNKDPNMKALKRRGFINHGSTFSKPALSRG